MGREAKITYEQVAAVADTMCAANIQPTSRAVRERLGNIGSMGTVNRLLQEWRTTQARRSVQPLALPPALQRALLDFMAQELSAAKTGFETSLSELRHEMADLALENERQGANIEDRTEAEAALRTELDTLKGRLLQTEGELTNARLDVAREREDTAKARIELAKALLRLEATVRLEADLTALRGELEAERLTRIAATQQAAVLDAKLEAARDRVIRAEALGAEVRT